MARKPNTKRPNRNTLYLAKSGGGKSQAMRQNPHLPKTGVRCMLFDPSEDQNLPGTYYFQDRAQYTRELIAAVKSGKGFRLGYSGLRSVEIFEWWCQLAWTIADGKRELFLCVEEMARVMKNGEAAKYHNLVLDEGRKYGIVYHGTSQRPQEISKTAYQNAEQYVIGKQFPDNYKKFAALLGVARHEIATLDNMDFFVTQSWKKPVAKILSISGKPEEVERITLKYQK